MFGFGKFNEQTHRESLEKASNNVMWGFYAGLKDASSRIVSPGQAEDGQIIAGVANWIFRFGDYGPKAQDMSSLKPVIDEALKKAKTSFKNEDERIEMTYGVIASAAAQDIPMPAYKAHFDRLLELGLVINRVNIPRLEKLLSKAGRHLPYYYYMQYGDRSL